MKLAVDLNIRLKSGNSGSDTCFLFAMLILRFRSTRQQYKGNHETTTNKFFFRSYFFLCVFFILSKRERQKNGGTKGRASPEQPGKKKQKARHLKQDHKETKTKNNFTSVHLRHRWT